MSPIEMKNISVPPDDTKEEVTPAMVAEAVNTYIGQIEPPVFVVAAPMQMTIWDKAKGFRNQMIEGGQEFLVTKIRPGKRSDFVVEMTPSDSRPYERVEIEDKRIELLSPVLDGYFAEAVGFKGESWKSAKVKFLKEKKRSIAEIKAAEEAKAKKEAEAFYDGDELFGAFA